jgi:signal transduction histidine kinase
VYNLLSNAIKYGSPKRVPLVRLGCRTTADYQVLTVEDNGLGMEARELSQLFTMFKRFHNHVEGSGIGLYMVKKMVENAGGHFEVESRLDQGSAFRIFFRR